MVVLAAMTTVTPKQPEEGFKNLKVLPKHISHDQLDKVMDEWAHSLGVHCNFCHVRDEAAKKMDWANDAKPEKEMAREMFKMSSKINEKYFHAKKDSLNMVMEAGVNCNTCHRGTAHPEVTIPEDKGPGGPPPGNPGQPGLPPANAPAPDKKE